MASTPLSSKPLGSMVKIKVGGTAKDFMVVHQGIPSNLYDASCTGTWLLMNECPETRAWHSSNDNKYAASTINAYLNNEWLKTLDADIQKAIKSVKLPYHTGYGGSVQSGAQGLACKVFLLSGYEVGFTTSDNNYFPVDGAKLGYFDTGTGSAALNKRIAKYNGSAYYWWLRSPSLSSSNRAWLVSYDGGCGNGGCAGAHGVRPAFILPSTLLVSDDGTVKTNTAPTAPAGITVNGQTNPASVNSGTALTIAWKASTDAEGDQIKYEVKRYLDGSNTGEQIGLGTTLTASDNIPVAGHRSVIYGVTAIDGTDTTLRSIETKTASINVVNNAAPGAPGSITVPQTVMGGKDLTVTWAPATDPDQNLSGYELERKHDSEGYKQVYKGNLLTFTETITKGWLNVRYRVRAYDTLGALGPYAESPERTVINNTAPQIACDTPSGGDLGEKNAAFSVSYTVSDEDNDSVTVTEQVDGVTTKTHTPELGNANSFDVGADAFQQLLNGKHTLTIKANDGKAETVYTLNFTKKVTEAIITMKEPMDADAKITLAVLSVIGSIPQDAEYKVEVTNNAKDDAPVWQDVTSNVKSGANIVFTNETATAGFAFNFKVTVKEGDSGTPGYIKSIQGGFQ